jgi:hypothetical protein
LSRHAGHERSLSSVISTFAAGFTPPSQLVIHRSSVRVILQLGTLDAATRRSANLIKKIPLAQCAVDKLVHKLFTAHTTSCRKFRISRSFVFNNPPAQKLLPNNLAMSRNFSCFLPGVGFKFRNIFSKHTIALDFSLRFSWQL